VTVPAHEESGGRIEEENERRGASKWGGSARVRAPTRGWRLPRWGLGHVHGWWWCRLVD
jgi:hypothetical protein